MLNTVFVFWNFFLLKFADISATDVSVSLSLMPVIKVVTCDLYTDITTCAFSIYFFSCWLFITHNIQFSGDLVTNTESLTTVQLFEKFEMSETLSKGVRLNV
jgi:hypothetical protein